MVSALAVLAAAGVVISWVLDVFFGLHPIGTLPIIYDVCLAFLTGWFFHLLVVVLPERRRVRAVMQTLSGNLMTIANNGRDLIRDLEFIGRCPERPITEDHVVKVCIANNDNEPMRLFLAVRLSVARDAYRRVAPFLASLPPDVAVAVQEVDQEFLNQVVRAPDVLDVSHHADPSAPSWELQNLRQSEPVKVWTPSIHAFVEERQTLEGYSALILGYCKSTAAVGDTVKPFFANTGGRSAAVEFWINHKINERGYPFADYPTEAQTGDA
ncbi:hypothetical protein [Diaminobutyricibacter sp. McL0608]|uniref:hypothetical protein n=1 Tax=Leifsonia sp. McL0608 TaxID=3143537 RepID=UPI0031F2D6BA